MEKMIKENTHCRKPDCKYHPDARFHLLNFKFRRCITCKFFVAGDNYVASSK